MIEFQDCMLICDSCDLGFHMACHSPALDVKPSGRWECFRCYPFQSSDSQNCQMSDSGISSQSSDLSSYTSQQHSTHKMTNGSNPYPSNDRKSLGSRHPRNGSSLSPPRNKYSNRKSPTSNKGIKKTSLSSNNSITKRFLPILPPHLHPHTGLLPDNWEDYEPDPDIPDVSQWDHIKIKDYFSSNGFSDDICTIFVEQVTSQSIFINLSICNS